MPDAYVISDLHLGAGADDPLEDFTPEDDAVFALWVGALTAPTTTLFINGDFIDFAQIEPTVEPGVPRHLLWDQAASRRKLGIAMAAHDVCFTALERFVTAGGTLHILTGNHDFDLDWPDVRADIKARVGGVEPQVAFTTGVHVYDGVHIEHGYQFTPENCPADPVRFRHWWGDREMLERVWGTDFLLSYFNTIEVDAPYVDKVKPTLRLAYHGIRNSWIPRRQLLSIITFLRQRGIPLQGLASVMETESDATLAAVHDAFVEEDVQLLVRALLDADEAGLEAEVRALDKGERALLARPGAVDLDLDLEPLPSDRAWVAGAVDAQRTMGLLRPGRETRAARDRLSADGVTHVVFGHTHRVVDGALGGRHFNPGTWNAHMRLDDPHVVEAIEAAGGITLEMLSDESLYRVDRRAVHIRSTPGASAVVGLVTIA